MVIAPHRRFAARHLLSRRNVVPTVGPVVNGVEQQAFVARVGGKIRFLQQRARDGEAGLVITRTLFGMADALEITSEPQQTLRGDRGRAAVDRFVGVERVGGALEVLAHEGEAGRAGVPVGHAVDGRVLDVEIGHGRGHAHEFLDDVVLAAERREVRLGQGLEKFDFLRIAAQDPGQAARPGRERRVALLAVGAAIGAVVDVEDRFMRDASAQVVAVAALAIIDGKARGGFRMLEQSREERDGPVHFAHELVAELMAERESAQRTDRVGEERVRPVERINVAEVGRELRPTRGLHGAGGLERQFVEIFLPWVVGDDAGGHEAQQIAVGADVVEPVVVHPDVGQVRRHEVDGVAPADVEEGRVACHFILINRPAELEALRPFGPAARGVFALDGEDRRALLGIPAFLKPVDFLAGKREEPLDRREEMCRREFVIDVDHNGKEWLGPVNAKGSPMVRKWGKWKEEDCFHPERDLFENPSHKSSVILSLSKDQFGLPRF